MVQKIEDQYKALDENPKQENIYFLHFARSERELKYEEILKKHWGTHFRNCRILEIGAGGGDNLLFFHRLGFLWHNLYANELLNERVRILKERLKDSTIISGNALDMNFEHFFDIVFQSAVFTSILDPGFKRELAKKMMQMVKEDGLILWYDFKYNNPYNKDVKGVTKREIRELFREANNISFHHVTLAPPIGRKIKRLYNLINFLFPFLRTHLIAVIKLK
jgi:2-polyprenyl-3-methyl-5-hydroxy-6-metoxy-1,4-benzoquinol methylase